MRQRKKSSGDVITISDEPKQEKIHVGSAIFLLYGQAKIGKTELAAYFPNNIFILTEPGGKFRSIRPVKVNGKPLIKTWDQFKASIDSIAESDARTVTVDTVDQLYQLCFDSVCSDLNVDHPGDMAHGKGWNRVKLEWNEWITKLCSLGKGVIFISHVYERTYSSPVEETTKTSAGIPNTGYQIVSNIVDFTFFYSYTRIKVKDKETGKLRRKMVRALICRPTSDIDAGDRTGLFPDYIKMPPGKRAYENLEETFNDVQKEMRKIAKEE